LAGLPHIVYMPFIDPASTSLVLQNTFKGGGVGLSSGTNWGY
jgi:hypothetical protein